MAKKNAAHTSTAVMSLADAKGAGQKWYFTGLPCAHGHIAKRSVSNRDCRACVDARERRNRAADPEPYRAREKRKYYANHDKLREQDKKRRRENPERTALWARRNYERDKQAVKDRVRSWQKKNPGRLAYWVMMRRARMKRATPRWLTPEQKLEMRALYEEAAAREGDWEVDHIVPLSSPIVCGLHVPWNLQIITATKNRQKGNRHET